MISYLFVYFCSQLGKFLTCFFRKRVPVFGLKFEHSWRASVLLPKSVFHSINISISHTHDTPYKRFWLQMELWKVLCFLHLDQFKMVPILKYKSAVQKKAYSVPVLILFVAVICLIHLIPLSRAGWLLTSTNLYIAVSTFTFFFF